MTTKKKPTQAHIAAIPVQKVDNENKPLILTIEVNVMKQGNAHNWNAFADLLLKEQAKPKKRIENARNVKAGKTDARHKRLDDAVRTAAKEVKPRKPAASEEFADLIRGSLKEILGYEPATTAIKASVIRIKKGQL